MSDGASATGAAASTIAPGIGAEASGGGRDSGAARAKQGGETTNWHEAAASADGAAHEEAQGIAIPAGGGAAGGSSLDTTADDSASKGACDDKAPPVGDAMFLGGPVTAEGANHGPIKATAGSAELAGAPCGCTPPPAACGTLGLFADGFPVKAPGGDWLEATGASGAVATAAGGPIPPTVIGGELCSPPLGPEASWQSLKVFCQASSQHRSSIKAASSLRIVSHVAGDRASFPW